MLVCVCVCTTYIQPPKEVSIEHSFLPYNNSLAFQGRKSDL